MITYTHVFGAPLITDRVVGSSINASFPVT